MAKKINRNLRWGYGSSLLILMAVGIMACFSLTGLLQSNRLVSRSRLVMQKLEQMLSTMKDAETGQRGYLLTGRPEFLEPYRGSVREALMLTSQLDSLTADHPAQRVNIQSIRRIISGRLDVLEETIARRSREEAVSFAELNEGKAAMDALRRAAAQTEKEEQHLLDALTRRLNYYTYWAPLFLIGGLVLGVVITLGAYRITLRNVREKDRLFRDLQAEQEETAALNEELSAANEEVTAANEELEATNEELLMARDALAKTNESLEQRVEERTRKLAASEKEAQALNEELAAANEELQTINEDLAEQEGHLLQLVDELRQAEERSGKLAAIVESSDDAIISKTLEGIITSWNRGAERLFGYSEQEMLGQSILRLIPEDREHEEPSIIARIKIGQRIEHFETLRRCRNGRLIDVSLTISPVFNRAGEIIGVSNISRDITEKKRDEQRKNDFIGMASHELKTPLTSLTGLIQVARRRLSEKADPLVSQTLEKADMQTRKMIGLINGFLNVSRLESGKLQLSREPVALNALIAEIISEMLFFVNSHQFDFEPSEEIMVMADREKIAIVINNLLSNAVKYSPNGRLVSITSSSDDGEALVSVKDEGIGISPEDTGKLFSRYYRVKNEKTQHISGFGVGLYLSAEIVDLHGGRIWAEGRAVGSVFSFTLPLA